MDEKDKPQDQETVEALKAQLEEARKTEAALKRENAERRLAENSLKEEVGDLRTRVGDDKRVEYLESQLEKAKVDKDSYKKTQNALKKLVDSQVVGLPDDLRKAVETLPLSVEDKADWLQENLNALRPAKAPPLLGALNTTGAGGDVLTDSDRAAMKRAEKAGVPFKDEKDFLDAREYAKKRYGTTE